jgi:hypothetical protein
MRWPRVSCLCALALVAGCAHTAAPRDPLPSASLPKPVITPDLRPLGSVQMVNTNGHFVVVSFASGFLPQLDQKLGVFHNGYRVGEVKITGPQREYNIVAEILAGDPQIDDAVKPD